MKKLFPIFLALLLLVGCGKEEPAETTVPTTVPAQTAVQTEATEDTGPEGVLEEKDTQTVYLMTRMSVLDDSGNESWYREYEYNELGQKTEEFEYASTGGLSYRSVYTYDETGLCTAMEVHQMDSFDSSKLASILTVKYTYDENGRVTLQQSYEEDILTGYDEFTYDEQGNYLTYKMYFGGELAYDWAYTYEYDANGNTLSREEMLNGELAYTLECKYDAQGRCTENITRTADGYVESRSVMVWEGNTETRTYYDMEDNAYLTTVSTYDEQGNITFQENQYSDGTVTMTEYFYEPFEITK